MRRFLIWLVLSLAVTVPAWAQLLTGVSMVRNDGSGGGGCDGTVDLSTGCVQPGFGVL